MQKILSIPLLWGLFSLLLQSACTSDADLPHSVQAEGIPCTIEYRLSTPRVDDPYATDAEMMKTILIIVVQADGTIESLEEITLPQTEAEYVAELEVTSGKKRIYGFSNLTDAMRAEANLASLSVGSIMPDLSGSTLTLPNGYEIDETAERYLPMSNYTDITVSSVSGQTFRLELIRMICKVKFTFTNESGGDLTLNQLIFTPLTTSSVYLLPADSDAPVFPAGRTEGDYTHTFGPEYMFADGEELVYTTYINESTLSGSGWFQILLTTQTGTGTLSEERMALTELSSLYRNDYLNIPLILSDYKLELDVRSYPPIGGYPAEVVEEGDAYHITFSGGGPFVIVPHLIQLSTGTEVTMSDSDWTYTYTDTTPGFFDEEPLLKDGEIYGVIQTTATGSVLFTLSAQITTSAGMQRTITYKIYLIQN